MESYRTTQEKMDYTNRVLTSLENKLNNYFVHKSDKEQQQYTQPKNGANKENEYDYINKQSNIQQMDYLQTQNVNIPDSNSNASIAPSFLQQENHRILQEKIALQAEITKIIQDSQTHKQQYIQEYTDIVHQMNLDHQNEIDKLNDELKEQKNEFQDKEKKLQLQIANLNQEVNKHRTMYESLKRAIPEDTYEKLNLEFIVKQSVRQVEQDQYQQVYKEQIEQLKREFEERKKSLIRAQKSGRSLRSNRSKSQKSTKSKKSRKSRSKSVKKIQKQISVCSKGHKPPTYNKSYKDKKPKKKVRIDLCNQQDNQRLRGNSCGFGSIQHNDQDSVFELKPALKNSKIQQAFNKTTGRVQRSVSGYQIQQHQQKIYGSGHTSSRSVKYKI